MADLYNSSHTGAEIDQAVSDVQDNKQAWNDKLDKTDTATLGTPTTNYELNTWSGEPLVPLDELNTNFASIDTYMLRNFNRTNDLLSAEWISAYHLAHRALEGLHNGTLGDRRYDLVLADFSLSGQWATLYHLNLTDDLKKPIPASEGFSEAAANLNGTLINDKYVKFDPADGLIQTMAEFTAAQNGAVTGLALVAFSTYSQITVGLRVLENGVQVAGDVSFNTTSAATLPQDVEIAFSVSAGKTYSLQVVFSNTNGGALCVVKDSNTDTGTYANKKMPLFMGTGRTYSAGYFTTPGLSLLRGNNWNSSMFTNFGTLYLWLCHSGTTPSVEVRFNGSGVWKKLACLKNQGATSLSGNSATRRWYKMNTWSGISLSGSTHVEVRITLGSSTCIVDEICGVFLG